VEATISQVQQEQLLREALLELSPRCRQLVHELFFRFPPKPYAAVAKDFGLESGSIGFIRKRCLEKLKRCLQQKGF
jgi:DNA-directed RNA polymerase specialized sigma24 family protein